MDGMMVGVRELKSQLSEYLRRVKAGETVIITERGRAIGRIVPEPETLEEKMQRLIDAGLAEWTGERPEPFEPVALDRDDILISDLILEMRE
jgi:prevent-host-death family protein